MPWYVSLIFMLLPFIFLICGYLWIRRDKSNLIDLLKAEKEKSNRAKAELEVEIQITTKLNTELKKYDAENKRLRSWYDQQNELLIRDAQNEYSKLVENPNAIDSKLDSLLDSKSIPVKKN